MKKQQNKKEISILGTMYTVKERRLEEDERLRSCNGYCDFTTKECVVASVPDDNNPLYCSNTKKIMDKTKRHEIVHAFLFESDLAYESWGTNEEIVDWIAIQAPKLFQAFQEAKAEEL